MNKDKHTLANKILQTLTEVVLYHDERTVRVHLDELNQVSHLRLERV